MVARKSNGNKLFFMSFTVLGQACQSFRKPAQGIICVAFWSCAVTLANISTDEKRFVPSAGIKKSLARQEAPIPSEPPPPAGENGNGQLASRATRYRHLADKGNRIAMFNMGVCCDLGRGIPQNDPESARWFLKSAHKGFAPAEYRIAYCYTHGIGVNQDDKEALRWYREAARHDSGPAMQ